MSITGSRKFSRSHGLLLLLYNQQKLTEFNFNTYNSFSGSQKFRNLLNYLYCTCLNKKKHLHLNTINNIEH